MDTLVDSTPGSSRSAYPTCEEFREKGLCGVDHFKDAVCGYAGPENWCDRSRKRCEDLGNLERFDGALPAIKEPWELPRWEIACGLGLVATLMWSPAWHIAAPLYILFSLLIVPAVRQELYLRYLHRSSEQEQDTAP